MVAVKLNGTVTGFNEQGDSIGLDSQAVTIEVRLLDANEQLIASATPAASQYLGTESLRFSADLNGANGATVSLLVSAPGYTSFARKLSAEQQIQLEAKLQAVAVQNVQPSSSTSISGSPLSGFNIEVSGADEQQSNALMISIPQSLLPEGTESLDVALRTFDPNNPEDAEFFPGAYADSDGNQLASVGFNFAQIRTDSNQPLAQAMGVARQQKAAKLSGNQKALVDEPVIINYQIPTQSCALLEALGDSAPNLAGFQVPVYTYDAGSGLWDLIGQGTLYNQAGQAVPASQNQFDCSNTSFTLEIEVTNEIFLREWWNLDYPLAFSQPSQYCASLQVQNTEGQPLAGINGFVMDNDGNFNFASQFFTTDSNGMAQIRIAQSSLNPDLSAEVIFYDQTNFGHITYTIALSSNCPATSPQLLELARPQLCEVSGNYRYENNSPVTRNLVYGFPAFEEENEQPLIWGFDFAYSDAQGNYRLNLPCGGSYELLSFATLISGTEEQDSVQFTRIDANLDPDELSDNGQQVVMKTGLVAQSAPLIYGRYNPQTNTLVINAYSTFDAFPMSAQVRVKSIDGETTFASFSGTFSLSNSSDDGELFYFFVGELSRSLSLPESESSYSLEIDVVDGLDKTWPNLPGWVELEGLQ